MDYKKSYMTLIVGVCGGALAVFLGLGIATRMERMGSIIAFIGLMAMLGGIGQAFFFYKCPACGKRLNIRGKRPKNCPGCGSKLDL